MRYDNISYIADWNKKWLQWGVWVAQSGKCPTLAQVMISWFTGSSPASGSVLMAQSLEPALDSVSPSPSLSAPPLLALCLCLSRINKHTHKILRMVTIPAEENLAIPREVTYALAPWLDLLTSIL